MSPTSLPIGGEQAVGITVPVVDTAYREPAGDLSALDLRSAGALIGTPDGSLPASIEAGPSLSGFGASKGIPPRPENSHSAESLPGVDRTSAPQPPAATPPPQILNDHTGIETLRSDGSARDYSVIDIPFEAELKTLLAPLAADPMSSLLGAAGSNLYFINSGVVPGETANRGGISQPATALGSGRGFDVGAVRRDFPILNETVNGRPLIWFDNAATTQKPRSVIERLKYFYEYPSRCPRTRGARDGCV